MRHRALDVVSPFTQASVERRFARARRSAAANDGIPAAPSRRELVARSRRHLRALRRSRATRSLASHPARREERRFSQNGEDGIIAVILERIGVARGTFVEIGAADGRENCTRALAETGSWHGVWIEGDPERAAEADAIGSALGVRTISAFVDRENVVELVLGAGIGSSGPDVLIVDVDGNDWHLWRALGPRVRPALVVTEINAAFGPWIDWVMPYDRDHVWREDRRYGATLRAFDRLARRLGYTLVACDSAGVNAFWVRADLGDRFPAAGALAKQFVPPAYSHPWLSDPVVDVPALAPGQLGRISLERPDLVTTHEPGLPSLIVVDVVNGTDHPIASSGPYPVRVTARWGDNPPAASWSEPPRSALPAAIAPGSHSPAAVLLPPGTGDFATLDVVQDGVGWAHDAPGWAPRTVPTVRTRG